MVVLLLGSTTGSTREAIPPIRALSSFSLALKAPYSTMEDSSNMLFVNLNTQNTFFLLPALLPISALYFSYSSPLIKDTLATAYLIPDNQSLIALIS